MPIIQSLFIAYIAFNVVVVIGCVLLYFQQETYAEEKALDYSDQVVEALKFYDRKCEIEAAKTYRSRRDDEN